MSSKGLAGNNNQVPPGYKKTEVGVIPEDWKVIRIQTAIDEKYIEDHMDGNHGELYPKSHEFISYGIPYVGANDFLNGRVNFKGCKFLSEARSKKFQKGIARDGDVLFAHNATVGSVALANFNGDFFILSTTATYFRCNTERLNNFYFRFVLDSQYFIKQYSAVMVQSTRYQVPITTQRKFFIAIPPLPEQKAIAQTLSDVDALITALDKLIAKKRNIKTATMQQLLAGKTRLPGFDGEWEIFNLGDLFEITAGGDLVKSEYSEIQTNTYPYPIFANSVINGGLYGYSSFKEYKGDCITITARGTLGLACYRHTSFVAIGRLLVLNPRFKLDAFFLAEAINHQIQFANESTGVPQLTAPQTAQYRLSIPKLEEQKAIASILSDMNKEITALEKRRAKTQAIKQGMMQELLTGRTRLINN